MRAAYESSGRRPAAVHPRRWDKLTRRALLAGCIVFLAEWIAVFVRGGLPSSTPARFVEAGLLAAACCFTGAICVALISDVGRSALRALGPLPERFLVGAGLCLVTGLGVGLEAIALLPNLGVPVYGRLGLGQPWQPGLVMAVALAAIAFTLAALGIKRGGRVVAVLAALIWLHLAVGPGYLDMAARVTPRRHLLLVIVCLATLDLAIGEVREGRALHRMQLAAGLLISLSVCAWAAGPFLGSNDAKLLVGGRMSVPYRMLALSAAAPWAPERWRPIDASGGASGRALEPPVSARPSRGVVLVLIDTLRPDALQWQQNDRATAPNLLAARKKAMNWPWAYATYPGTGPSAAAMFGRATSPSLLTRLRNAGVRSVAVTTSGRLLAPDFDEVDDSALAPEMTSRMLRYADGITSAALRQVDLLMAGEDPFLLLVHYMAPHAPYLGDGSPTSPARSRYRDEVAYVDEAVAPLLDRLQELGELGALTTIVASDHGEEFLEHGYGTHGVRLYDESMRIVLFMSGSGVRSGESANAVSGADLAPTLADLLDISRSEETAAPDAASEGQGRTIRLQGATSFGCIRDGIKWIYDMEVGYWERYDLVSDPAESNNGADKHEIPGWCGTRTSAELALRLFESNLSGLSGNA